MFGLGLPELVLIVLAAAILLFGSKYILNFARSLGRFTGEFKKSKRDIEDEMKRAEESTNEKDGER